MTPLVIGIAGGSGSGKTTLARCLYDVLGGQVCVISCDDYYKEFSHLSPEERAGLNFDHPDALDVTLLTSHLDALKRGEAVIVPQYDFSVHTRKQEGKPLLPAPVIVAEGILLLSNEDLRSRVDVKIYVDTPEEVRHRRRLARDATERGRTRAFAERQWQETVLPMHERFVEPCRTCADLLLDGTAPTEVSVRRILEHCGLSNGI